MADESVCVIGGGAWGTALAQAAAMAGRDVSLTVRGSAQIGEINASHTNQRALGGQILHERIRASLAAVPADIFVLAVPAQSTRAALAALDPALLIGKPVVLTAKGLETDSLDRQSRDPLPI